jgi:hypothetical protein
MNGILQERSQLSPDDKSSMFSLLDAHFEGATPAQFERDLEEKNWVILLRDSHGQLRGFSTLLAYETSCTGAPVSVICSGDTIVDPSAWRSPVLSQTWIRSVHRLRSLYPRGPYYWLLIASGFRTYRFLPVFWRRFMPSPEELNGPDEQGLLCSLATERFADAYDPTSGIVRLPNPQRLRSHLSCVPDERRSDPHVAHFLKLNPGHSRGDELACLASLDDSNLTPAGWRMAYGATQRQPA